MQLQNLPLIAGNLGRAAWNRVAKLQRRLMQQWRRRVKGVREVGKDVRATTRGGVVQGRDAGAHLYVGAVKTVRYWKRVQAQTVPRLTREVSVRRQLRRVARGTGPIVVGPWLSEVGYEVLYWVPFLRWFCDRYGVDRERLVVVSRGGVAGWYRDVADRYVELLDLFDPATFAARNLERQRDGEQKQRGLAAFDTEILARVRSQPGLADATVCHPSLMFRLLGQFWLGNESLHYVLEHTRFAPVDPGPSLVLPPLPDRFVAMKFYTGVALPDTLEHRRRLRQLVASVAERIPVVALDTRLPFDEHQDYTFADVPGVTSLTGLTPQNNLGMQTAVVARADGYMGTCGGLAWLAPFLGTSTLAVYADDAFLAPHLYAAQQAYRSTHAARFVSMDLHGSEWLDAVAPNQARSAGQDRVGAWPFRP